MSLLHFLYSVSSNFTLFFVNYIRDFHDCHTVFHGKYGTEKCICSHQSMNKPVNFWLDSNTKSIKELNARAHSISLGLLFWTKNNPISVIIINSLALTCLRQFDSWMIPSPRLEAFSLSRRLITPMLDPFSWRKQGLSLHSLLPPSPKTSVTTNPSSLESVWPSLSAKSDSFSSLKFLL